MAATGRLEAYARALEALVAAQDALLVAYRLGNGPQGARAADRVGEARDRVLALRRGLSPLERELP